MQQKIKNKTKTEPDTLLWQYLKDLYRRKYSIFARNSRSGGKRNKKKLSP